MRYFAAILVLTVGGFAQQRDYLTADEIDQVREAQEPNARLQLYVHFARERIAEIQQFLGKEKPGRSALIHDALEDYTHIIEAIDTVSDDGLRRKVALDVGMKAVADAEKEMLATLNKIEESDAKDLPRFEFALKAAIDTTSDSEELSQEDLHSRATDLAAKDTKEKQEKQAILGTADKDDKKTADATNTDTKDGKPKRKPPTLYKPGEKPPDQQQ
jgi:hypothetical protein